MNVSSPYSDSGMIRDTDNFKPARGATRTDDANYDAIRKMASRLLTRDAQDVKVSADFAAAERQVLARESAIKASAAGGNTNTTYSYATGPDGRKYITGAEVSVVGSEDVLDSVPGGGRTARSAGERVSYKQDYSETDNSALSREASVNTRDERIQKAVADMEARQSRVIAHEAAHKAAAGRFGGPASYTYTTGPDGKRYITGGEVPISTPATNDPKETLRNARQVMSAAMAPGDPSGADIAASVSAAQMAASARARIASGEMETDTAGIRGSISQSRYFNGSARKAYNSNLSPRGLWTSVDGFGPRAVEQEDDIEYDSGANNANNNFRKGEYFDVAA
ncbi:hypothetical protein FACS1894216_01660 [Synergistales bacterium]|nr:hypothetical protein FACS1894216_01660 [Synergistales bacterium]